MELYNKKYVYFEWDKNLEDKKGFVAQNIESLKNQVNHNPEGIVTLSSSDDNACPFTYYDVDDITCDYQFAYYDPDYEVKRAFFDGKTIQARFKVNDRYHGIRDWFDINKDTLSDGYSLEDFDLRLKPKEWYIILDDYGLSRINSKKDGYVVFKGTEDECIKQMGKYKPFEEIMLAWKHGEKLQYFDDEVWKDVEGEPAFDKYKYRIKPSRYYAIYGSNCIYKDTEVNDETESNVLVCSIEERIIDNFIKDHEYLYDILKAGFSGEIVEYRELYAGDDSPWLSWKIYDDTKLNHYDFVNYEYRIKPKEYVPFDTVQELIDYWDEKHPSNRPADTLPLIWIKSKKHNYKYLITEFYFDKSFGTDVSTSHSEISLEKLFEEYTFLCGATIGKVKEE